MTRIHFFRAAFAAALLAVLVLSLWPSPEPSPISTGWDKSDHVVAYLVLGLLGIGAFSSRPRLWIALLAYGGGIELLQGFVAYRSSSWADFGADATGLGLALLLGAFTRVGSALRPRS
ncbi:MAG TPA: VanZ family protein [Zeimonas sp.]